MSYYFIPIIAYFDLTWFSRLKTVVVIFSHRLLKTIPLSLFRLQPKLSAQSTFEAIDPGIIDGAGHHVRPAGVCEEGTAAQGRSGTEQLNEGKTKRRRRERLHASLPARRD